MDQWLCIGYWFRCMERIPHLSLDSVLFYRFAAIGIGIGIDNRVKWPIWKLFWPMSAIWWPWRSPSVHRRHGPARNSCFRIQGKWGNRPTDTFTNSNGQILSFECTINIYLFVFDRCIRVCLWCSVRSVMFKYLEKENELEFHKIFDQSIGKRRWRCTITLTYSIV